MRSRCTGWIVSAALALAVVAGAQVARAANPPTPPNRGDIERILASSPGKATAESDLSPLSIVLLADRKDHGPNTHDYPRWQSRWSLLLGGSAASPEKAANLYGDDILDPLAAKGAAKVRVVSAQHWPDERQWDSADLIVAYCYLQWTPERIKQVDRYLKRGGGLAVIHSATWTRPKASSEVASVLGVGGFQRFRHGALDVELISPQHPICAGLPRNIRFDDESYWPPTPASLPEGVALLAGCREAAESAGAAAGLQPMFWTYPRGKGRVFGCVPGHCSWTFDDPYFRILLLRGMAWAAGEDARRFDCLVLRSAAVAGK